MSQEENKEVQKEEKTEIVCFTNMCMIEDDRGKVLALDKVNDSYTGTTFPGGHVEKEEPFQMAVIREVREETGLEIRNPVLCGVYHWYRSGIHNVIFLYRAREFTGSLGSSEEGQVYWISLEKFLERELAPGMEHVVELLKSPRLQECWMHQEQGNYVETMY